MRLRQWHRVAIAGFVLTGAAVVAAPATAATSCPWMDTSKTPDQRASLLLAHSTLAQKERWLVEQPANSPKQTSFTAPSTGVTTTYPVQVACTPSVTYTDGPEGIRGTDGVTAFPAQISLASTWNQGLSERKGAAQGAEAFGKGKNAILGPGLASGRTPLSGRTPEYLGEDPLLSGALAAAMTRGIQDNAVMSVLKHYVANEQETDRTTSSSNVSERVLREAYERPFQIAIAASQPAGVMCSYNQINGVYSCENPLLNESLRQRIGFDGYTVSDFYAIHSTAESLNAGLDQELNAPIYYTPQRLAQALAARTITEKQLDAAAFHVVRAYIRAGLFDHPVPTTPIADVSTAAHKALARTEAEQGSVLLKNAGGVLPLQARSGQRIAVIGATASKTPTAGVSATAVCSQGRKTPEAPHSADTTMKCEDVVAPLDSITGRAAQNGASVTFDPGTDPAAAAKAAAGADVAVVFGYQKTGEFADLPDLHLQGGGDALISAVARANKNTVVVLETGSAVEMPWLDQVRGVVEAWYPGEQQGPALAALLFGDAGFSGHLPMTFPRSVADVPTRTPQQYPGVVDASKIRQVQYSEGLAIGYRWYQQQEISPLFAFGYGLSYTSFSYSELRVSSHSVRFEIRNTGHRTGTATPQAYLTVAGEPGKRLAAFDRVTLAPGASTTVQLAIPSGGTLVSVGSSAEDLPLHAQR